MHRDIKIIEQELAELSVPVKTKGQELRDAFDELRKTCKHTNLVFMRGRNGWGDKRMCASCGLVEDETVHGTGFHVLRDRGDVWMKRARDRMEWETLGPTFTQLIEWCYGDKDHPPHCVPAGTLLKGNGTRCAEYTGYFE
jgi:hypothetical protein